MKGRKGRKEGKEGRKMERRKKERKERKKEGKPGGCGREMREVRARLLLLLGLYIVVEAGNRERPDVCLCAVGDLDLCSLLLL